MPPDPVPWSDRIEARIAELERQVAELAALIGKPPAEIEALLQAAEKLDAAD